MRKKIAIPAYTPASDVPLIREYMHGVELSDKTRLKYVNCVAEFAYWLGEKGLLNASRSDVKRFMTYLNSGERTRPGARKSFVSDTMRKGFLMSLRSFYGYWLEVEHIEIDPTHRIKTPRIVVSRGLTLTREQLRTLLDAPGSARDRIQTYLLAYTAARSVEILNLRWRDVDFENGLIHLFGKGSVARVVEIHPDLLPQLRRWQVSQAHNAAENELIAGALAHEETAFVLLTDNGKRLADGQLTKQLKRRARRVGLLLPDPSDADSREAVSRITAHALRRTFATFLLNDGIELDRISDVLGNTIWTCKRHYAFSGDERRRQTVEAFAV